MWIGGISAIFWFIFSIVFIRVLGAGSRASGQDRPELTDDQIREITATAVVAVVWRSMLEMFGSIKTIIIESLTISILLFLMLSLLPLPRPFLLQGFEGRELSSIGTSVIQSPWCSMEFRTLSLR